ncbi:chemotaxis protein CheW [Ancylothrix sp. C2]|uniref:chemotaxis protein CheW n=1 Tax=Ancylothrix sp. D3o TaxID=2953691 RepID=UPI0021BAEFC0|nr:chemotaxis protein CheW [Ancylothrix sp. D3o]MCT7951367.1 chemotaxis protein CheW [Ancylothrix sp. D3o]
MNPQDSKIQLSNQSTYPPSPDIPLKDYFCIQLRQSARLALPIENVAEVFSVAYGDICPIPGVATALLGVVNQNGQLIWVLELADLLSELLGLAPSPIDYGKWDSLTVLLITNCLNSQKGVPPQRLACVVSALKGVVQIDKTNITAIPEDFSPAFSSFFLGVVKIEDESVAVLNVSAVFAALRLVEP